MKNAKSASLFMAVFLGAVLSGCSGLRIVDSQVAAFSKIESLPAGASWRFERLPSQLNLTGMLALRQAALEAMAAKELAKAGFQPESQKDGATARFNVQLTARIQRQERSPFDDPWDRYGIGFPGRDYIVSGNGKVIYLPVLPRVEPPWFIREVGLIIRDASDGRVVYETSAKHEGRWADDEAVLPAMFAAALQGFPKPPEGQRMVTIEIPR